MIKKASATVVKGHQVASGTAKDSPYPAGTIVLQKPFFAALGINLAAMFEGTLNLSVAPCEFKILQADYQAKAVKWLPDFPAEDFSFVVCRVEYAESHFPGLVYYPHPETKVRHFQKASLIEVLCPFIEGIDYGDSVSLEYDSEKILLRPSLFP